MANLILRPSGLSTDDKPWALQLRWHNSIGPTEYQTLCYVSDKTAKDIIGAGAAYWLFGELDWVARLDGREHDGRPG